MTTPPKGKRTNQVSNDKKIRLPGSHQDNTGTSRHPTEEGRPHKHPNNRCEQHKDRTQGRSRSQSIPRRGKRPLKAPRPTAPTYPGQVERLRQTRHKIPSRPGPPGEEGVLYNRSNQEGWTQHPTENATQTPPDREGRGTTIPKENRRGTRTHRQE